ncbi:MAG: class I SAM-dependent methyltransferase [Planctomycetota bacterium]
MSARALLGVACGAGGVALAASAVPGAAAPVLSGAAEAPAQAALLVAALAVALGLGCLRFACGRGSASEALGFAGSGLAWGAVAGLAAGAGPAARLYPFWVAWALAARAARERGWRTWGVAFLLGLIGAVVGAQATPLVDARSLPWACGLAWLGGGLHPLPREVPDQAGTRLPPVSGWFALGAGTLCAVPALAALALGPPRGAEPWVVPGLLPLFGLGLLGVFLSGATLGAVALASGAVALGAATSGWVLAGGAPSVASAWAWPLAAALGWGASLAACREEVLKLPGSAAARLALSGVAGGAALVALGGSRAQAGWPLIAGGLGAWGASLCVAAPLTAWFEVRAGQASRDPRRAWQARLRARFRLRGPLLMGLAARRAQDPILERLPRWLPAEGPVLVAGCGVGITLARLAQLPGLELTAVEHDPRRLRVARSALRPTPVTWIAGDPLEAELGRYRAVWVEDTLCAYSTADQERLLARLAEHLEPGGTLVLVTPPPNGAWGQLLRHWALGLGDFPRSLLVPTDLGRLLNRCGLALTHSQAAEGSWPRFVWVCRKPGG